MVHKIYAPLALALFGDYGTAAVLTAPTATITPAPLLRARDVTTVGYISTGTSGGTTLWDTVTVNDQNQIIATSSNLFQICDPSQVCEFFYCSNDYVVYPSSSFYCGMSNETCSSYVLATDIYDQAPLTNYWCDSITQTGGIIYEVTPDGSEGLASSPVADTDPSTDPATEPSDSSSNSHSSSKTPKKKKKSPAGAIAGGVIGGLVVLGAIIFGVVFCLRKKRKNAQLQTPAHPQAPPPQQQLPPAQYYGNDQKPVGVAQVQQMSPPQQMPLQQQYYDPNVQQQAPQFYDPNAQPAYGQQAGQGRYAMPEKTPAATNMQANPYYADNGGVSGPASPVPVYTPTPTMSPANVPVNNAPPANVTELPTPPPASFNELPAQRM